MPNLVGIGNSQVPTNAMLGGLAYQDSVGEIDIEKIKARIGDTAVDIFVYDTRKDSDGGAWRHRTQDLSWYNESASALRGARKEFPVVAVLVLQSLKLTIYDGDDPNLPMWMVVTGANNNYAIETQATCTAALNGIICIGCGGSGHDFYTVNFLLDAAFEYSTNSTYNRFDDNIATRSSHDRHFEFASGGLVSRKINDVAMTVLQDPIAAKVDENTGLPIPTIAVATNDGISIIHSNGDVADMTVSGETDVTKYIAFTKSNKLAFVHPNDWIYFYEVPASDLSATYWNGLTGFIGRFTDKDRDWDTNGKGIPINVPSNGMTDFLEDRAIGHTNGVDILDGIQADGGGSQGSRTLGYTMHCGIATDFNTGWQYADIERCLLSSTDSNNITGTDLVTNSYFTSNVTGWNADNGFSVTHSSGRMVVNSGSNTGSYFGSAQTITTIVGRTYMIAINIHSQSVNAVVRVSGSSIYFTKTNLGTGYHMFSFVSNQASTLIQVGSIVGAGNNREQQFEQIIVREVDINRSVRGTTNSDATHFLPAGTVPKNPVAEGAELMAYGPFSSGVGLVQSYNTDLDYGTGDFYYMLWIKVTSHSDLQGIFSRQGRYQTSGNRLQVQTVANGDGQIAVYGSYTTNGTLGTGERDKLKLNQWHLFGVVRRSGTMYWYNNGVEMTSHSSPTNYNNADAFLRVGGLTYQTTDPFNTNQYDMGDGSIALFRTGARAPSPEQIKKMYEDEKKLFAPNAKCTLYGSSDAVTGLAYDDSDNTIHVGTSSGRSQFQGLNRINNTTTAVTTAISASDGLVAEQ